MNVSNVMLRGEGGIHYITMLQVASFLTLYMCLLSLKLCIMNVEINYLNQIKNKKGTRHR